MTSQDNRSKAADDLRQKLEALIREQSSRTPEDSAALSPEEIRQTLHELRVHQIELEMQNKELRTAQARIEAGRERYFDLYDLAPVGYCTLSNKGLILDVNLTAATMLCMARDVLINQPIFRFILEDDQDIYYLHRKKLFETGEPQECEMRLVKDDGAFFWAHLTETTAQTEDGALVCRVVLSDITERKRSEEELKRRELTLNKIFDVLPIGLWFVDKNGKLIKGNSAGVEIWGAEPKVPIKEYGVFKARRLPSGEEIAPDDWALAHTIKNGTTITDELLEIDAFDGWKKIILNYTAPVMDDAGGMLGAIVVNKDITARWQAEEKLRESEEKYRLLIDNLNEGIWQIDKDGYTVFVNDGMAEMLGYTVQEMQGKHLFGFMDEQEAQLTKDYMQRRQKGIKEQHEHILVCKDGSYIFTSLETSPVYDKDGKYIGALAGVQDVTARKQAEKSLRRSENYYRAIFETSASAIFILEEDTTISHVNSNFEKLLGYSKQEVEGKKSWTEFIHPDDLAWMKENHYLRLSDPRTAPLDYEFRFFARNGDLRHGVLTVDIIAGTKQSVASIIDITERKRTEEALRESEKRYRTILNEMSEGYHEVDLAGNFTFFNEAFLNLFGYSRDEMMGTNFVHYAAEEAIAKKVYRLYNEMHKTGVPIQNSEWDIIKKDGERRTLEFYASVVKDSENIPTGFRGIVRDITDRKRAEHKLLESEKKYRFMAEQMNDVVWTSDLEMRITYISPSDERILGFSPEERMEQTLVDMLTPFSQEKAMDVISREYSLEETGKADTHRSISIELEYRHKDGTTRWLETLATGIRDDEGLLIGLHGVSRDITERKQAEKEREKLQSQLNQAQKMESIGRLAGGVAHDFNNKLTIIIGYSELILETIDSSDPLHETIQEIITAGKRSEYIVRQLLAFARKQTISPVMLDLNDTISSMLKMLQRLIGENIDLAWHPGKNLCSVRIDPSQVDQIMANLAVNSRDAISDVGKLTIETDNIVVDEDYCRSNPEAIVGQYVMLAVSDDGCGIEEEIKEQLFDPYFTTKEVGKGTGLGLPTIYGIVKQNKGFMNVYSEPGEGTTFKLYFPSCEETKPSFHSSKESTGNVPTGTETVLVVEDEKTILQMSKQMLERLGYTVETAGSPAEALQISDEYDGTIDLLITDVVMPEMNGRDLSVRLSKNHPGLKTLYMSGYTANVIAHHGVLDEGVQFIQKPFSLRDLAAKVREVLKADRAIAEY